MQLPDFITPREYQFDFLRHSTDLIESNPDQWNIYSSPTGTGKSIMILMYLIDHPTAICITPRLEIIQGMMEKLGHNVEYLNDVELVTLSWNKYRIITPIRLRNILAGGGLPFRPHSLVVDECHHDLADTYQDIGMYLNGVGKIGLTATPFRGTPQGTKEFLSQWNDTVYSIVTLKDAVDNGHCSLPTVQIWPLVDDDVITVTNGDFNVKSADPLIVDRIKALVECCKKFYCRKGRVWDRPTMFSVPSTVTANELTSVLNNVGLPAVCVTQATNRHDRVFAFKDTINCQVALVQIDVVSEGVDLPIRRLIDIRPTMSPVKWMQQLGRITRPTTHNPPCDRDMGSRYNEECKEHGCEPPPEYICCCRNLERHCYLMEGLFPNSTIYEAQTVFTDSAGPAESVKTGCSRRSGMRAVGLEGLGRFVITPVQLLNGITVFTYHLVHTENFKRREIFVLVHPNHAEPVVAEKVSTSDDNNEMKWGKWNLIESIPDVKGCRSAVERDLTIKQKDKWNEQAANMGLNPHVPINNRMFQIMPFMWNTGTSFARG